MKKFNITVEGKTYEVEVEEIGSTAAAVSRPTPASAPAAAPVKKPAAPVRAGSNEVSAPMPGTILQIKETEGQSVKAGDVLCILEAMKMENEIVAPQDGVIAKIHVAKGTKAATGDILISLK